MALSSLSQLRAAYDQAASIEALKVTTFTAIVNRHVGMIWETFGEAGLPAAGAKPTTLNGTQYSSSSAGAIPLRNTQGGSTYALADVQASGYWFPLNTGGSGYSVESNIYVHLWDRIWANGFNQTLTTVQNITFPPLTRYSSGEGLSMWLKYQSTYSTPAGLTITVNYTNQAGVSRTVSWVHDRDYNFVYHEMAMVPIPMLAGDSGVRAVNSVQLSASAGASFTPGLSIVLCKYLGAWRTSQPSNAQTTAPYSLFSGLPQFDGAACLTLGVQAVPAATPSQLIGPATTMPIVSLQAKVLAL